MIVENNWSKLKPVSTPKMLLSTMNSFGANIPLLLTVTSSGQRLTELLLSAIEARLW